MPHNLDSTQSHGSKMERGQRWLTAVFASPLLWGGLLTLAFYSVIPWLPAYRELAQRYFCGHPIEYATTALCFIGMSILILKAARVMVEKKALRAPLLSEIATIGAESAVEKAERIEARVTGKFEWAATTALGRRILDACAYVRGRKSGDGLEEHLKYLAELGAEHMHGSYALVRTITWAVPILGFLGTVIGITMAIANVTPEQLDTSLSAVTGGLAVAFDTTALALALSMLLVFGSFAVERMEQQVLDRVESFGIKRLACVFPAAEREQNPLVQAETEAARHLVERTEQLICEQTELWQDSMESLRSRWVETLARQQSSLDEALQQGMATTLSDHAAQLAVWRDEFVDAYRGVSEELAQSLSAARETDQERQQAMRNDFAELWDRIHADVLTLHGEFRSQTEHAVQSLTQEVARWHESLNTSTTAMAGQLQELHRQGELLSQVIGQEEQLARLQGRLTENLQTLQAVEKFEETLHSLSAAIHLLTARTKPKAA